jgi:hypothetical protein
MIPLNPPPEPLYQGRLCLNVPQAPAHIWAQLSPAQQQQVYHSLAQVCRQVAHQLTRQEQPHDHQCIDHQRTP